MKKIAFILVAFSISSSICAQQLEIEGKVRIDSMDLDNGADSVVIRQPDGTLAVRDVATLSNFRVTPTLIGSLVIGNFPTSVYVSGRYAYVVDSDSQDLKIIDVSDPAAPFLIRNLGIGFSPTSVYVSGRYAYIVDSGSGDLKVIDVSTPGGPFLAGSLDIGYSPSSVHVSGQYAYVVDQSSQDLKVIDVSNPSAPTLTGILAVGLQLKSVYVSGRYAYVVENSTDELKVIDVSDPANPSISGSGVIGDNPHSVFVSGRYAYAVMTGSNELKVIDVSNPTTPTLAGSLAIGDFPSSVYVSGRYAYIVDTNTDDLKVVDVSDPSAPFLSGSLVIGGGPRSVYVSGRYAYVVDFGSNDLKVIDVSGGEFTSMMAHSLEAGNMQVRNDIVTKGQVQVTGGVNIGTGGLFSDGDVGVNGSLKLRSTLHLGSSNYVGSAGDDGLVLSDSTKGSSDLILVANDAVIVEISDNANTSGSFEVWNNNSSSKPLVLEENGDLSITGIMSLGQLGTAGSDALCRNGSNEIALCSSSRRYKKDIHSYKPPASVLDQLRPVTFRWKDSNEPDIGLVAEEVADAEPLLITYNDEGEVEGVKYDRIGLLLIDELRRLKARFHKLTVEKEHLQKQIDQIESRQ